MEEGKKVRERRAAAEGENEHEEGKRKAQGRKGSIAGREKRA
jgi:hypothetical protein